MPAKYLNVKEAAQLVGVSEDEIKKMLERRELHGYRDGADWKFKVDDVERIAKHTRRPPAPRRSTGSARGNRSSRPATWPRRLGPGG